MPMFVAMLRRRPPIMIAAVAAMLLASFAAHGTAATSTTVVSATVPSATTLITNCPAAARSFGVVLPGSPARTSIDCTFTFGSSNDTSTLRVAQADFSGRGMWAMTEGALDMTWGDGDGSDNDGIRREGTQDGWINEIVRQRDGTFIAAGVSNPTSALAIWKFDANGIPVAGFGASGVALLDLGSEELGEGVAIDSLGRIYVSGTTGGWASNTRRSLIARFNPDGTLDTTSDSTPTTSFNGAGYVTEDLSGTGNDMFRDVAIDSQDRAVTVGFVSGSGTFAMYARRFTTSGSYDSSFNGTGRAAIGGAGQGFAVAIQADDKPVIGGLDWSGAGGVSSYTARLNVNGTLDTNADADPLAHWDVDGVRIDDIAPAAQDDRVHQLHVLSDGRVAFAGSASTGGIADMSVGVFTATGQPDTSFNGTGRRIVAVDGAADSASGLLVEPGDTGITISGVANNRMAMARVTPTGGMDTDFSGDGMHTLLAGGTAATSPAVALAEDGSVVLAGNATVGGVTRPTLVRMVGGPSISDYDDAGGTDWAGSDMFGICMRAISGATTTWTADATCAQTDGLHWRAVNSSAAQVATVASGSTTAVASFRFGLRPAASQPRRTYVAPVEFELVAP